MRRAWLLVVLLAGCSKTPPVDAPAVVDADAVREADLSVLYVGNSHTHMHDLPGLVGRMYEFTHPGKKYRSSIVGLMFLSELPTSPAAQEELKKPWKHVVLQAQKISMSGKVRYSTAEGVDYAKAAKAAGAEAWFFVEWGRRGVAGDGMVQEGIYREMAEASGGQLVPISRAWDAALAERPDLPLFASDGNHESTTGAFLTACVIYARLTGESPLPLAEFDYPAVSPEDRRLLVAMAAAGLQQLEKR